MTERTPVTDYPVTVEKIFPWPLATFVIVVLAAAFAVPALANRPGHFTDQQVQAGKQTYNAHCSACHGGRLQGGAGPALKGQNFATSVKFGNMSTTQLFDFISKHMPKNNPGSLKQQQYIEILAYLLDQNGFSAGKTPLDKSALGQITLLPLPADSASSGSANGSGQ